MASKRQGRRKDDKESARQSPPQAAAETAGTATNSAIIQQAQRHPSSLTQSDVLQLQRTIGNQAVSQLLGGTVQRQPVIQRMSKEMETEADEAIKNVTALGAARLVDLHKRLNHEYTANDDYDAGSKAYALQQAIELKAIEVIKPFVQPLLTTIKNQLTQKLNNDTPQWVNNLPNIEIMAGEGISGGMSVGMDTIFIVPSTGTELLLGGSLLFSISHEIGHLVSGNVAKGKWGNTLKTNDELDQSGVAVDSTVDNKTKKFEEIRADIFGAGMLASHLGVNTSDLAPSSINGGIDAAADDEHPSFEERKGMLKKFHGVKF